MPNARHSSSPFPTRFVAGLRVVGTFALGLLLWKICTGYDPDSWILGLPAAALFTWFVVKGPEAESGAPRLRFQALPGFLLYFLAQSFRTGVDVARRALFEGHAVHPGFTTYRARLPDGAPRAVFANMISLLPGTLSWSLSEGVHKVHILSGHALIYEELAELECRVGKLYGLELEDPF